MHASVSPWYALVRPKTLSEVGGVVQCFWKCRNAILRAISMAAELWGVGDGL